MPSRATSSKFVFGILSSALFASAVAACSSGQGQAPASEAPGEVTGTVGLNLQVSPGVSINQVAWTIHNPSLLAMDRSDTVDVSKSDTIQFVVGGLPAGSGYTILLATTTSNGIPCAGSAPFAIAAKAMTNVSVNVACTPTSASGGNNGQVSVNGNVSVVSSCAAVSSLSASPTSVSVGGAASLSAQGVDNLGSGGDVAFAWGLTGGMGMGTFSSTTGASPTFTCTSAGTAVVTVTATVADSGVACTGNTASINVTCTNATADAGADVSTCVPTTCAALGLTCGSAPDGCGNTLNCNDGVKDGSETGIDCGGNLAACPTRCAPGATCGQGSDCVTSFCTDGVCCITACTGVACQACSAAAKGQGPDGVCGAVAAGRPDPTGACASEGAATCGTTGACNGTGACALWASGTVCRGSSCSNDVLTPAATCNGTGACAASGAPQSCFPYACTTSACPTSCATDAQCAAGTYCAASRCVPVEQSGAPCTAADQCASGVCTGGVCQ